MMKKMMKVGLLQILLFLATKFMVFCDEKNIEFLSTRNDTDTGTSQMLFNPKSHIDKFVDSWRYYAKANDIAKREKLKMALRDALHSIERPQKHSVVTSDVDANSIKRIKEAALLLKEFKEMYSLSETVKSTLGAYQEAKKKLPPQVPGVEEISKTVVQKKKSNVENKRDMIPIYRSRKKSFIDRAVDSTWLPTGTIHLRKPVLIKRNNRISVRANPLTNGQVGIEYSSIDPRYSNVEQAEKAMRAAVIVLKYSHANKKLEESEDSQPEVHFKEKTFTKTTIPGTQEESIKPVVASVVESLVNGEDDLPAADKAAIESLGKDNRLQATKLITSGHGNTNVKKEIVNKYVGQLKQLYSRYLKIKGENDTVENALQFQNEIINSNLGNVSRDLLDSESPPASNNIESPKPTPTEDGKGKSDVKSEMKDDDKYISKSLSDDPSNKQEDTVKQLKEARMAKVKYELAKHELAHKIKELYVLANNYEKDETENQILEVKNLISHTPNNNKGEVIPGSRASEKSSIAPTPANETTSNIIEQRDDVHPGIALAGLDHSADQSSKDSESDGVHKGFTMGAKDVSAHLVESPTLTGHLVESPTSGHQVESPKSAETKLFAKSDYDYLHLPGDPKMADTKKDESVKEGGKVKNDDATLSIIAQAIQEDMKEIQKTDGEGGKGEAVSSLSSLSSKKTPSNMSEEHKDKEDSKLISEEHKDKEDSKLIPEEHKDKEDSKLISEEHKDKEDSKLISEEHKDKEDSKLIDTKGKDSDKPKDVHDTAKTKQDLTYNNESVDDYLTKALSDIISQDSLTSEQATVSSDHTDHPSHDKADDKDDKEDPSEKNKQIVEKAMRQHAKNPNLPLPLVDTKGDKIKLNPALNESINDNDTTSNPQPAETKPAEPPKAASAESAPEGDKQPATASKEKKPSEDIPTDVLLHATDKNVSTALPDIDLKDPENKKLLEKASHMEESIAAAQDKMYSEIDLKPNEREPDVDGHKVAAVTETPEKNAEKPQKEEDTSSRDTLTSVQDIKPSTEHLPSPVAPVSSPMMEEEIEPPMRPALFRHQGDPYGSIQEHATVSNPVDMADMEDDAYDDEEPPDLVHPHHRHHHHHHHRRHHRHHHRAEDDAEQEGDEPPADDAVAPDAAEDEDDEEGDAPDDEEDEEEDDEDPGYDKKSRIKYLDDHPDKRSFNTTVSPRHNSTVVSLGSSKLSNDDADNMGPMEEVHIDELEDSKRSGIPKKLVKKTFSYKEKSKEKTKEVKKANVEKESQGMGKENYLVPHVGDTVLAMSKSSIKKHRIDELEDVKRSTVPSYNKKRTIKRNISRTS